MIKVNLARNLGMAVPQGGAAGISEMIAVDSAGRAGIAKALLVFVIPIGIFVYEKMNISTLQDQLKAEQTKLADVESQKSKFGDVAPRVAKYEKLKGRVDKEVEVVRSLSRTRLREVKALDALQTLVTGKTWLEKLSISGNTASLTGFSVGEQGATDLIRALDQSSFFSKVVPRATSQATKGELTVKKFELDFQIGKNN